MRSFVGLSLLPLLVAGSPVIIDTIHKDAAPIHSSMNGKQIADSYMVVLKKHVSQATADRHTNWVNSIHLTREDARLELRKRNQIPMQESVYNGLKHTYNMPGMTGYAGHFSEDVIEQIRRHPDVDFVERDSEVHTLADPAPQTETGAPWGLARISHRDRLGFASFNKYLYSDLAGEGVDAYVIDTGTFVDHVDFEGRAHWGKTMIPGDDDKDGNGHGTHCSGTIGGKKFGVAKKVNIYGVKVLNAGGSGSMSDVVKGVEWATSQHDANVKAAKAGKKKGFKGSVANMSLGGGKSVTLEIAVNAAVEHGMHFAVAAGNDDADACDYSPAAAKKAVTVCASTLADERAYFSNFGKCTDIFAPGLDVLSTWIGSPYATNKISGTSMASPHICGLLAYYLGLQPAADSDYAVAEITPKQLKEAIIAIGTKGALSDVSHDTPNVLAWNGAGESNFTKIIEEGAHDGSYSRGLLDFDFEEVKAEAGSKLTDLKIEIEKVAGEIMIHIEA